MTRSEPPPSMSLRKAARSFWTSSKWRPVVRTDAARGFEAAPKERTFNLVRGFECVALAVGMELGKEVRIQVEVAGK